MDDDSDTRDARRARAWDGIPFAQTCGMHVIAWSPAAVTIEMAFAGGLRNGKGGLHGGAVSALIDSAAAAVVMAGLEPGSPARPSTVSMTVNYFAATTAGVRATATISKAGRRIQFVKVEVADTDGRPVAEALVSVAVS